MIPLTGLTVLVHGVIVTVRKGPVAGSKRSQRRSPFAKKILSGFIIGLTSLVVIATVALFVRGALRDPYSNIWLVHNAWESINGRPSASPVPPVPRTVTDQSSSLPATKPDEGQQLSANNAPAQYTEVVVKNNYSLR